MIVLENYVGPKHECGLCGLVLSRLLMEKKLVKGTSAIPFLTVVLARLECLTLQITTSD